jgi:hypothetical protein
MDTNLNTYKLKQLVSRWSFWKPVVGIAAGGFLGFLYYYYIGCSSGSCTITSNPYSSIIFGSLFGLFVVSSPCSRGKC